MTIAQEIKALRNDATQVLDFIEAHASTGYPVGEGLAANELGPMLGLELAWSGWADHAVYALDGVPMAVACIHEGRLVVVDGWED